MGDVLSGNFQLHQLKRLHADLETQIGTIISAALYDQLAVQRLKRQKIQLKEQIEVIQNTLTPDIIA